MNSVDIAVLRFRRPRRFPRQGSRVLAERALRTVSPMLPSVRLVKQPVTPRALNDEVVVLDRSAADAAIRPSRTFRQLECRPTSAVSRSRSRSARTDDDLVAVHKQRTSCTLSPFTTAVMRLQRAVP
jgi:hypothetical protein